MPYSIADLSREKMKMGSTAVAVPFDPSISPRPAMGGCDSIVAGSSILTAMYRRLAIRRTSQGFEVVHRFAGEWLGATYPAHISSHLPAAQADLAAHVEKDADKKRGGGR